MTTKNLGLVQAIWVGTTAPTNTFMLWYDTNTGVNLHKYYDTNTSTWETFIINTATAPLEKVSANISLLYNISQFELIAGRLSIKADVLSTSTPPFAISDITGLQAALDSKVDKVFGKSLMLDTEIARLASVTNYTHPVNHSPAIITQDLNNRFVTDVQIAYWNAKQEAIGYTPYDALNPAGYITADYFLDKFFLNSVQITLPSGSTVQGRIDLAVAGVDYPTGWLLYPAGDNANDIMIEHGLNRRVAQISVWSESVLGSRLLIGNAAYSGAISPTMNILRIEALATVATDIVVNLVFS